MPYRRRVLSALAALGSVVLLAGCSSAGGTTPSTSATPSTTAAAALTCPKPGSASNAVKVTGSGTAEPTVSIPKSLKTSVTERTTIRAGSGATIGDGVYALVSYAIYNARTGKRADHGGWTGAGPIALPVQASTAGEGFVDTVYCAKIGSRLVGVLPPSQSFGTAGSKQLGFSATDLAVFVVDVREPYATGAAKALPAGFPGLTLAADGKPTVKIPATSAPTTSRIADSKTGGGSVVKSGDKVTLQYQGVNWRTGEVFDQSWGKTFTQFVTTQVYPGFAKALVGHKVGSQVVAVLAPKDWYDAKNSLPSNTKKTDDLVFVIDILATGAAS